MPIARPFDQSFRTSFQQGVAAAAGPGRRTARRQPCPEGDESELLCALTGA